VQKAQAKSILPFSQALFSSSERFNCFLFSHPNRLVKELKMDFFQPLPIDMFPQPLEGIVEWQIAWGRTGRVKLVGISWAARLLAEHPATPLQVGQVVMVVGRQGNTLLVQPKGFV